MKQKLVKRLLSAVLTLALLFSFVPPVYGRSQPSTQKLGFEQTNGVSAIRSGEQTAPAEEPDARKADEIVRVSILLDTASTIGAGYATRGIARNRAALSYRETLRQEQARVTADIEKATRETLDVVWNLTLAGNIISANVPYGELETIRSISGVQDVVVENRYAPCVASVGGDEPMMATSDKMIGSQAVWAAGYTGAGMRIAVIDTGLDLDHQSFTAAGLNYSLNYRAGTSGMTTEDYLASLDLLDGDEIASVASQLNISAETDKLYLNTKVPFAYNYVDGDYDITHDNDSAGEHGSHVAGIAAANAYIPREDGTFANALETVKMQGVAPDAQLLTMKVFGKRGGAYDSDYLAAIEDAIVLGADAINLSLGSASAGFNRNSNAAYQAILDALKNSDTVVAMSAGNADAWSASSNAGSYLYADDINMDTVGSPASFESSLSVASVDNAGYTGKYIKAGEQQIFYLEPTDFRNQPITTLLGEQSYIMIDGYGTYSDFSKISANLKGKIAVCSRGETSFYEKASNAVWNGAIGTIIYNNQPGVFNMDLSSYYSSQPVVSITQADAEILRSNASPVKDDEGNVLYYEGKLNVCEDVDTVDYDPAYYTMSSFSSYGVPGSLTLKPEITAPGGSIYSVNGAVAGGTAYETMSGTSMASPQIAGMAALLIQYIEENGLAEKTGLTSRQLANSLLMSTSEPLREEESGGGYYSLLRQGAGLANIRSAVSAAAYLTMDADATVSAADGKIKAELGADENRSGVYDYGFTVHNLSEQPGSYTLGADYFTQALLEQEGGVYLDSRTISLAAETTFTVDGVPFVPTAAVSCDLDGDGDTDADDAQYILDYAAGLRTELDTELADLDGDGKVTTHDAYCILHSLQTAAFEIPAGGSAHVRVHTVLSEETKNSLNTSYVNGAYLEGFAFVQPVTSAEGAVGVTHSIPVLGFFGNWTDASMFDKGSYTAALYGDETVSYVNMETTNDLVIKDSRSTDIFYQTGNPYEIEESYPADRAAISGENIIYQYNYTLIRNAAALAMYVTDESGSILAMSSVRNQENAAYYYTNGGTWENTFNVFTFNRKVKALGAKEDERISVNLVAIPEYYSSGAAMTKDDLAALLASGKLGKGAFLTKKMVVDSTAPELLGVSKDLMTGSLIVTARDNQYIATMQLIGSDGSLLASVLPAATEKGETTTTVLDLSQARVSRECKLIVGDYAGNETAYTVDYGGEPEDYSGRMFGFTSSETNGSGLRWVEIDPDTLHHDYSGGNSTGMTNFQATDLDVCAAEYVDGYVIFVTATDIYAAKQEDLGTYQRIGSLPDTIEEIRDMAYSSKNGKLYLLDDTNTLYSLDLLDGTLTSEFTVELKNPRTSSYEQLELRSLAIDENGSFYAVNNASGSYVFLYHWTLDDVQDGKISALSPINNTYSGYMVSSGIYCTGLASMTWDRSSGKLYLAAGFGMKNSRDADNELWVVDPETAKASKPNAKLNGQFYAHVVGLYRIPGSGTPSIAPVDQASRITLNRTELTMLPNSTASLSAEVGPWLLKDPSVTWSTDAPEIVSVENGTLHSLAVGTATITATTAAEPHLTASCTVTVEPIPDVKLSALLTNADGQSSWAEFRANALTQPTTAAASDSYYGGALYDGKVFVHDGSNVYGIDPDTFARKSYGEIAEDWLWSDAAESPDNAEGFFGDLMAICSNGLVIEMVDPEDGTLRSWDLTGTFMRDPLAAIAYAGNGKYPYGGAEYSANFFYILSEAGMLYQWALLTPDEGNSYKLFSQDLGMTGLDLTGTSSLSDDLHVSMHYDPRSGYIYVATSNGYEPSRLAAIAPETQVCTDLGSFGSDIMAVTTLYQYDRATDLTLRFDRNAATMYEGDTLTVETRVLLGSTEELTWTTDAPEVATVQDGVITAVAEGTANITATTVAVNAAGEHVSQTIAITVAPYKHLNTTVKAQITTESGSSWVEIDLNSMQLTTKKSGATKLSGGGYAADHLYGSDTDLAGTAKGHIIRLDPETYQEETGVEWDPTLAPLDVADAPKTEVGFTLNNYYFSAEAFYHPLFIANNCATFFMEDFDSDSVLGWQTYNYYSNIGAIAYVGDYAQPYDNAVEYGKGYDKGTIAHDYLVLGSDGRLYRFRVTPYYNYFAYTEKDRVNYNLARSLYGNINMKFADYTKLSMIYVELSESEYGLVIADGSSNALYYVDLTAGELTCEKVGKLADATAITALYGGTAAPANHFAQAASASSDVNTATEKYAMQMARSASETAASADLPAAAPADGSVHTASRVTAASEMPEPAKTGAETDDHTVTLTLCADADVTNGLLEIAYDPACLTYEGSDNGLAQTALHVDAENGRLTLAYASGSTLTAGTLLASLRFSYEADYLDTALTVRTLERGTASGLTEEASYPVQHESGDAHDYQVTETVEPTCTEDGYIVYTCSKCGDSYRETLKALGHAWSAWQTVKPATCTEEGLESRSCSRCGETETRVIPADPNECPSLQFTDLDPAQWYHEGVDFVLRSGLMRGIGDGIFAPNDNLTRAQLVTVLYRMAGGPAAAEKAPFADVRPDAYYADAVAWGYANGIVMGVSETEFCPDQDVTREQLVTLIARYAAAQGIETNAEQEPLADFTDASAVSAYAREAFAWAVENGLVNGMEGKTLQPGGTATRAQIAAILLRLCTAFPALIG